MTPNRRDVLELAGVTATIATVGTTDWATVDTQETREDELPEYSRWLTLDDGALEFSSVDWTALGEDVTEELERADPEEADVPPEYEDDPMIAPLSDGLISTYFFVGLTLAPYRLGRLLEAGAFESTVEGLLEVNEAFVATGAIVPEEIDDQLTAEPEAEFIRQLERTAQIGEYDVYTPVEDDVDAAIAVGSDALVVADGTDVETDADPVTTLETTVAASADEVGRAADESEAVEWLVGTAGRGDAVVGQYGGPFDTGELAHSAFEGLEDAEGIVSSLTAENEETATGVFAAIVDEPDEAVVEEVVGASADERSIDIDGDRVTVTGTWREDVGTPTGT